MMYSKVDYFFPFRLCFVPLMCVSILSPIANYNFIVSLEIYWGKSSNFLLFYCFVYSRSFAFPWKFYENVVNFYQKKKNPGILIGISLIL